MNEPAADPQQEPLAPSDKLYYSIGEVAAMFNLAVSHIRFWEKEFDILQPKKNAKGDRFFTRKDIENLRLIYHLVKEKGYTLEGAKQKMRANRDGVKARTEMIDALEKVKGFMVELKNQLNRPGEA